MIQISVTILKDEVTTTISACAVRSRERLAVEEGRRIDTFSGNHSSEVPHLVKGDTLRQADDNADTAENCEEPYRGFASTFKALLCG